MDGQKQIYLEINKHLIKIPYVLAVGELALVNPVELARPISGILEEARAA